MNYQENEQQGDEQGTAPQNQNLTGQPLGSATDGMLDDNNGPKDDWSEEEGINTEQENIESGIEEDEELNDDGVDEEQEGRTQNDLNENDDTDEFDEDRRNNTSI